MIEDDFSMDQLDGGNEDQCRPGRYRPYFVRQVKKSVKPPMLVDGVTVISYYAPLVEYVDTETGEILQYKDLPSSANIKSELYIGERCCQRYYVLTKKLRPEIRKFATFVLEFRNSRRGITPGISQLVKWYARLTGREPRNIRRNVEALYEAGILESENMLGALFQYAGTKKRPRDHLVEEMSACIKFNHMLIRSEGRHFQFPEEMPLAA